jgi:hypothetical protein
MNKRATLNPQAEALGFIAQNSNGRDLQDLINIFGNPSGSNSTLDATQQQRVEATMAKYNIQIDPADWNVWQNQNTIQRIYAVLTSLRDLNTPPPGGGGISSAGTSSKT